MAVWYSRACGAAVEGVDEESVYVYDYEVTVQVMVLISRFWRVF